MKCAAAVGYWSLLCRPKDKMSNFLTKILACLCESLRQWHGGGVERDRERVPVQRPIKNKQAGVLLFSTLLFWVPTQFVKCVRDRRARDG